MTLKYHSNKSVHKCYIVYDLEFIGNILDLRSCKIWEIAAMKVHTQTTFHGICYPFLPDTQQHIYPPAVSNKHTQLSQEWLKQQKAEHKSKMIRRFIAWLSTQTHGDLILVSHNNHKTDKFILEHECFLLNLKIPKHVFFLDTLPLCRYMLPGIGDWSLQSVFNLLGSGQTTKNHRAQADVHMLYMCLKVLLGTTFKYIPGILYAPQHIPLNTLDGIGYATERKLIFNHDIVSVQELRKHMQTHASTAASFGLSVSHWARIVTSLEPKYPR